MKRSRTQPVISGPFCSGHVEYNFEFEIDEPEDETEASVLDVSSWCTLKTYDTFEATPRPNQFGQLPRPHLKPLLSNLIDRAPPALRNIHAQLETHFDNSTLENGLSVSPDATTVILRNLP